MPSTSSSGGGGGGGGGSSSVAAERRMDLASLFCMIGRHGPAVALAVIAVASVLAGFVIYRSVRGKRRKAAGAAADRDARAGAAESDASAIRASPESTDMSDGGSPDVKKHGDPTRSDLKIRHRRPAAAMMMMVVAGGEEKEEEEEEDEEDKEDAAGCPHSATDDTAGDVAGEVGGNASCLEECEPNEEGSGEGEERVLQGESQEVDVIPNNRQEEKSSHSALINPACFEQASLMGENVDLDSRRQDNQTTLESNSGQPQTEDVPVPCTPNSKDEELEEENPDSVDCSSHSDNCLSPEEVKQNEEVEEERVDHCLTAEQAEIWSPSYEQETKLASTQQDRCDQTDKATLPIQNEDENEGEDGALAGEVTGDLTDEDHSEKHADPTDVRCDGQPLQLDKRGVEITQGEDSGPSSSQEDAVLRGGADEATEKMQTSDNIVSSSEERHSLSVADSSTLCCLSTAVPDDNRDGDGLSGISCDGKAQITSVADFPDLSLDFQQPQKDDTPSLDHDADSAILGPQTASRETESQPENENGAIMPMAEECDDHACHLHIQSSYIDQQSGQMAEGEVFDKSSVAAEKSSHSALINPACFEQASLMGENVDDDSGRQDNQTTLESNSGQPQTEDVPVPCTPNSKDEEFEEENPDSVDCSSHSEDCLSPEEVKQNEEVEEERVDHCLTAEQAEIWSPSYEQETKLASTQQDRCDQTDKATLPIRGEGEDEDEDGALAGEVTVTVEECDDHACDPHIQSSYKDQQSGQMVKDEAFDKSSVAADHDTMTTAMMAEVFDKASAAGDSDTIESITLCSIVEETSCPQLIYQDQEGDNTENTETFGETRVHSATDAPACDNAIPLMSEEITCPDMVASSQNQQSDERKSPDDFSEVTTGVAPVMTEDIDPPVGRFHLPSFEQIELRINDISFPSVESGISSMAVSPDLQDAGNDFDMTVGNMVPPVINCDLQPEEQSEPENSLFADDVATSAMNEGKASMVFGPYPSSHSQLAQTEHTGWSNSFAANEDMLGHEVEDSYHRAMDQFVAQIAASATTYDAEMKQQTDMKAGVEVGEVKKKNAGVNVEKKVGTKAEGKEEDCEKTEISIMEATMDNNEWITDGNYQVLPWMNLSAASQDQTKTKQPPSGESKDGSAVTAVAHADATEVPPSAEVGRISSLCPADEITDGAEKIGEAEAEAVRHDVSVTFGVHYFTQSPFQKVAVTGDHQELGNWKGYVPLEGAGDGRWAAVVSLPAQSHVEWKFVVVDKGEVCRWEECGNRLLETGYGGDLVVHKWWGLL